MKRDPIAPAYLDMRAAAQYSSLSVRTLHDILKEPDAPPVIRLDNHRKLLIHRADLDAFLLKHRTGGADVVGEIVDGVILDMAGKLGRRGKG